MLIRPERVEIGHVRDSSGPDPGPIFSLICKREATTIVGIRISVLILNVLRVDAGVRTEGGVGSKSAAKLFGQTAPIGMLRQPVQGPEPTIRRSM